MRHFIRTVLVFSTLFLATVIAAIVLVVKCHVVLQLLGKWSKTHDVVDVLSWFIYF